uniref:Uncharacterized protein n=1 Tax=Hyaloperonospora arabidopsidis (strain Emoy2) TaxID=559515 RepID=M4B9U2_HYAAE
MANGNRQQQTNALGQIPLSSGEIELYARQDEMTRRRRRLLAMRDEERRLAQQVTQRYRNNLKKLQHWKSLQLQKEVEFEPQKIENGNQVEKCCGRRKGWTIYDAQRVLKDDLAVQTARRRRMKQNNEKGKAVSRLQTRQASSRDQAEQGLAQVRAGGDADDTQSVTLANSKNKRSNGDMIVDGESRGSGKLEAPEHSISIDMNGEMKSGVLATSGHDERSSPACERDLITTTLESLQCEETEKLVTSIDRRDIDALETSNVPLEPLDGYRDSELKNKADILKTKVSRGCSIHGSNGLIKTQQLQRYKLVRDHQDLAPCTKQCPCCSISKENGRLKGKEREDRLDRLVETERLEKEAAKRYGLASSVAPSKDHKKMLRLNTGQSGKHYDIRDRSFLEMPDAQWSELVTRSDRHSPDIEMYRNNVDKARQRPENLPTSRLAATHSTSNDPGVSPQHLARSEGDEKAPRCRMEHSRVFSSMHSAENKSMTSRNISCKEADHASVAEHDKYRSAISKSRSSYGKKVCDQGTEFDGKSFDAEGQLSLSALSGSVSQKSLSRLDEMVNDRARYSDHVAMDVEWKLLSSVSSGTVSQISLSRLSEVANGRARTLGHRFADPHMTIFSESEDLSTNEGNSETESCCPPLDSDSGHSFVAFYLHHSHHRDMYHEARRHSTSAASVTQYSLPLSDAQSLLDESLDQVQPGHPADDSFVNELVPFFPMCVSPSVSHSSEEGNEGSEEFADQLIEAQNSGRSTAEQLVSPGRKSRQRLSYYGHQAAATEHSRRQAFTSGIRKTTGEHASTFVDERDFVLSSGWNSSTSSVCGQDAESLNASADSSRVRRHTETGPIERSETVEADICPLPVNRQSRRLERDVMSDVSIESNVSSLAVRLKAAAVTTRWNTGDDGQGDIDREYSEQDGQQYQQVEDSLFDQMVDAQRNTSDQSYASS